MSYLFRLSPKLLASVFIEKVSENLYRFSHILRRGMSVAHGHLNGGMAEDFFHSYQVNTTNDHISGRCVAQIMKPKIADSRLSASGP